MDIFLFMILAIVIVFICAVFIYMSSQVKTQLHLTMDNMTIGGAVHPNVTIDNTIGKVDTAYQSLYWISLFLIFGMIMAIFIGNYMVTSRPVFFVPYIFVVIIAVVLGATLSNAYEQVRTGSGLTTVLSNFVGSNFILSNLPIIVAVIGIGGGILMFIRMDKGEERYYG